MAAGQAAYRGNAPTVEKPRRGDHAPPPFTRPTRRRISTGGWARRVLLVLLLVLALLVGLLLFFYGRIG
jgi:hypothetical protein